MYTNAHETNPVNLTFIDKAGKMGTTRPVQAEEELCIEYGIRYWLFWNASHSPTILTKVFTVLIMEEHGFEYVGSLTATGKLEFCRVLPNGPMMRSVGLGGAAADVQWKYLCDYARSGGR